MLKWGTGSVSDVDGWVSLSAEIGTELGGSASYENTCPRGSTTDNSVFGRRRSFWLETRLYIANYEME